MFRKVIFCKFCNTSFEALSPKQLFCCIECRFWAKVNKSEPDHCWNWTGYKFHDEYGQFRYKTFMLKAHRVAWILTYGPIPDDRCVLHKCDNPSCVNPGHLFLGTRTDNAIDMYNKNRQSRRHGESNPAAKLTENQVIEIKNSLINGIKQRTLAKIYRITETTISDIKFGRTWSHVTI